MRIKAHNPNITAKRLEIPHVKSTGKEKSDPRT